MWFGMLVVMMIVMCGSYLASAQSDAPNMDMSVSDGEKTILFAGFAVAVIGIFLFLAKDIILRRKTSYDSEDLESKKDKTYEKYHSDWGDDYEDIGKGSGESRDGSLLDCYGILGVPRDATQQEIKSRFRELAKSMHPDRTGNGTSKKMAEINEAYKTLSDRQRRARYDRHLD